MFSPSRAARLVLLPLVFLLACSGSTSTIGPGEGDAASTSSTGDSPEGGSSSSVVDGSAHGDAAGGTAGSPDAGQGGACLAIGGACSNKSQCCSAYCSGGKCACNGSGYACKTGADCCSGLSCFNGICSNQDPSAAVPCQACGGTAGSCPLGPEYCQRATALATETYCAPDCSKNPNVCPPDMPCTPLYLSNGQSSGHSGCIATSLSCSAPDGGALCDVLCAGYGAACPCPGYTCGELNGSFYCQP